MTKTEESKLEKEVERFMREERVWQLARYQAQSNQNGIPDRLYLYKGFLLGLELKASKGKPTELQLKKLKMINDNGGIGLIVRDINILKDLLYIIDCIELTSDDRINKSKYILNKLKEGEQNKK